MYIYIYICTYIDRWIDIDIDTDIHRYRCIYPILRNIDSFPLVHFIRSPFPRLQLGTKEYVDPLYHKSIITSTKKHVQMFKQVVHSQ